MIVFFLNFVISQSNVTLSIINVRFLYIVKVGLLYIIYYSA